MVEALITISSVDVSYGNTRVLEDFNLEVNDGEFLTLLGPSGCGKTTLLRLVAGFVAPAAGTVTIDGRDVTGLDPEERPVGIVFQGYALFPHLTVAGNVEFGLRTRRIGKSERRNRVGESLEAFGLTELAERHPADLSGGQQQRVAIARAIVNRTRVLLMDEPLSNLDTALRLRLRDELRDFHRERGITTVFVTHDQEEALSLSDRVAVLLDGQIAQLGTPHDIYHNPTSEAVCRFVGHANELLGSTLDAFDVPVKRAMRAYLRPERLAVGAQAKARQHRASGRILERKFIGPSVETTIEVAGAEIVASVTSQRTDHTTGTEVVECGFDLGDLMWVPK